MKVALLCNVCEKLLCFITQTFAESAFTDIRKFSNTDNEVLVTFKKCLGSQLSPRCKFCHFCVNIDQKSHRYWLEECYSMVQICDVDFQVKCKLMILEISDFSLLRQQSHLDLLFSLPPLFSHTSAKLKGKPAS